MLVFIFLPNIVFFRAVINNLRLYAHDGPFRFRALLVELFILLF